MTLRQTTNLRVTVLVATSEGVQCHQIRYQRRAAVEGSTEREYGSGCAHGLVRENDSVREYDSAREYDSERKHGSEREHGPVRGHDSEHELGLAGEQDSGLAHGLRERWVLAVIDISRHRLIRDGPWNSTGIFAGLKGELVWG